MHPILFRIGNYPVYSYGVMLLAALLVGVFVAGREMERHDEPAASLYPLVALLAFSGLIGARLFYVFGHLNEFSGHWSKLFDVNTVGMVFYGALVFAFPVALITIKWLKLPVGTVMGAGALAIPLGLGIARFGCFLNGCCGGKASGLPWAVTFPATGTPVHPTQLYEAALDFALFALLLLVVRRFAEGWDLFLISIAGYAAIRFFVEFFRFHANPHGQLFFQLMSAAIFAAAASALLVRRRFAKSTIAGADDAEPGSTGEA